MGRDDFRNCDDPGVPALTLLYTDLNDFYFSGHMGAITMWTMEFYTEGHKFGVIYCMFLFVFYWTFMVLTRLHYVIDLFAGVMMGHWAVF